MDSMKGGRTDSCILFAYYIFTHLSVCGRISKHCFHMARCVKDVTISSITTPLLHLGNYPWHKPICLCNPVIFWTSRKPSHLCSSCTQTKDLNDQMQLVLRIRNQSLKMLHLVLREVNVERLAPPPPATICMVPFKVPL